MVSVRWLLGDTSPLPADHGSMPTVTESASGVDLNRPLHGAGCRCKGR